MNYCNTEAINNNLSRVPAEYQLLYEILTNSHFYSGRQNGLAKSSEILSEITL